MDKLFTIAGTSTVNGVNTYRVANGKAKVREGVLRRAGHTDTVFHQLPNAMDQDEAVAWLRTKGIIAVVPPGQRRGDNGGTVRAIRQVQQQQDAHVRTHAAGKAAFVARMAAARRAKRDGL